MNNLEITGEVVNVLPIQKGTSAKGEWSKQEFVVQSGDKYPKIVCMELWNDGIAQFLPSVGDTVTTSVNVESREYNGKYYTNVKAWKVQSDGNAKPKPQAKQVSTLPVFDEEDNDDGLPF